MRQKYPSRNLCDFLSKKRKKIHLIKSFQTIRNLLYNNEIKIYLYLPNELLKFNILLFSLNQISPI